MSHHAQLHGTAQRYWAYGLAAAREASEFGRGTGIISRMTHQMIYLGHPDHAVALIEVAHRAAARDDVPRLQAKLSAQHGRILAALGHPHGALEHLDRAHTQLDAASTAPTPPWIAYFTPAKLGGATAVSHRDLRELHHRRGIPPASTHFAAAIRQREPSYDRSTAMDLVGLAAAQFAEGDLDAGCATARQSIDLAAQMDSALITARINTLISAAAQHAHNPQLTDLYERVRAMSNGNPVAG